MEVKKSILLNALETVKPGLSNKEMIEQSTSFCFINNQVVTYNDEISIRCPVDIDINGAINSEEFYSFLNKVKKDELILEKEENEIILKSGRSKAKFLVESEIKLPLLEISEKTKWKLLSEDFVKGLKFCMGACSRDMSNPILTCVHLNLKEALIEGADAPRIANYHLQEKTNIASLLIPAKSAATVVQFKPIKIAADSSWIHFVNEDGAIISCRVWEEKYVDTQKHFDHNGGDILTFPKEMDSILERANVFAKRDHIIDESIDIELKDKFLKVHSSSSTGSFDEKARVKYSGEEIKFSITPYLLKDILNETNKARIVGGKILLFEGENWKYLTLLRG